MKIIKIATYWSPEQADDIYNLLDELRTAIWEDYGDDIIGMHLGINEEQKMDKNNNEPLL